MRKHRHLRLVTSSPPEPCPHRLALEVISLGNCLVCVDCDEVLERDLPLYVKRA